MKVINTVALAIGAPEYKALPIGAKPVGVGYASGGIELYYEQDTSSYSTEYWEFTAVRPGESYHAACNVIALIQDPNMPVGMPGSALTIVGRITG